MGLDAVEMVMAVEDAFDIRIDDAEAEKLVTPGMVIDFVISKVTTATSATCLTQRSFNLFRKLLLRNGELKRSDIAPNTRLGSLIPKPERPSAIEKFTTELGIKDRVQLVRPNWLTAVLFGVAVFAGLSAAIFIPSFHPMQTLLTFACSAILLGLAGAGLTRNQRSEFPKKLQTVGDMARWVMRRKPDLADASRRSWTRDQVAARVREIVVETLDCESTYSEDANFVKDLGLS